MGDYQTQPVLHAWATCFNYESSKDIEFAYESKWFSRSFKSISKIQWCIYALSQYRLNRINNYFAELMPALVACAMQNVRDEENN